MEAPGILLAVALLTAAGVAVAVAIRRRSRTRARANDARGQRVSDPNVILDGECVDAAEDYRWVVDTLLGIVTPSITIDSFACTEEDERTRRLVLTTSRGTFEAELEGHTDWVDSEPLLEVLNRVLAAHDSPGRLHALSDEHGQCEQFVYVGSARADALGRAGRLTHPFSLPAERVTGLPCQPGTQVEHHANARVHRAVLARALVIEGIPCAAGPIELGRWGHVEEAVLSRDHPWGGVTWPAGTHVRYWDDSLFDTEAENVQAAPAELTLAEPLEVAGPRFGVGTTFEMNEGAELVGAVLHRDALWRGIPCAEGTDVDYRDGSFVLDALRLPRDTEIGGVPCAHLEDADADIELHPDGALKSATLSAPLTRKGIVYPAGTRLAFHPNGVVARALASPSNSDDPLGPVCTVSVVGDPDVRTLDDLARWYPPPPGFAYEALDDGQFRARRIEDSALFSVSIEAGRLWFDEKVLRDGEEIYDTTEVMRAEAIDARA